MAAEKVTEQDELEELNPTDILYVIRGDGDYQSTVQALFASVNTPALFKGVFGVGGTPQTFTNSGEISSEVSVTLLSTDAPSVYTIEDGVFDGQVKIVIMESVGAEGTLNGGEETNVGVAAIEWNETGHSMILLWVADRWWPIGGTANITY